MLTFHLDINIFYLCQSGVASAHPTGRCGALSALFLECLGKSMSLSLYYSCCISSSTWCHIIPEQLKTSNYLFIFLFLSIVRSGLNLQKILD